MKQELPGLVVLWEIRFRKEAPLIENSINPSEKVEKMCHQLMEQCRRNRQITSEYDKSSMRIQKEINHLRNVVNKLKEVIKKFNTNE